MLIALLLSAPLRSLGLDQGSPWGPLQIVVASMAGLAFLTLVVFVVRRFPYRREDQDEEVD
jgi:hypothetical protein